MYTVEHFRIKYPNILERALGIAIDAHAGQIDKGGTPYIFHPLWVMEHVNREFEKVVAVLHDVIEDSVWTLEDLREAGMPSRVIDALEAITRKVGEPYAVFINRVNKNEIARVVKIADITHNMDLRRLNIGGDADTQRMQKYAVALVFLAIAKESIRDD